MACGIGRKPWKMSVTAPLVATVPDFKPELSDPGLLSVTIPMLKSGASLFAAPAKSAPGDPGDYLAPLHDLLPQQHDRLGVEVLRRQETMPQYFQFLQSTMVSYAK